MRRLSTIIGCTLFVLWGCGGGGPATPSSVTTSDLTTAPTSVSIGGKSITLETSLWRDFQPIAPRDGKPLVALLHIKTEDGLAADEFARRYPNVTVDRNVLYIDNGQFLTAAGAAAGLDLCLHLVRRDYGAAIAPEAARIAVMPLERAGGQSQFIVHQPPAGDGTSLEPLMRWLEGHLHQPLPLERIARRAAMSTRTLSRLFHAQTGTTLLQ
jgi:hypothetical protein